MRADCWEDHRGIYGSIWDFIAIARKKIGVSTVSNSFNVLQYVSIDSDCLQIQMIFHCLRVSLLESFQMMFLAMFFYRSVSYMEHLAVFVVLHLVLFSQ